MQGSYLGCTKQIGSYCSVANIFNSLLPHELSHTRLPCPSLSPGVCSNSCPVSQWCHPTISSSVAPLPTCLQSLLASEAFPVSWVFASGGQRIGASASASVLSMNIQGWFLLGLTSLISLLSKGLPKVFSSTTISILLHSAFFMVQSSHHYMTIGNPNYPCSSLVLTNVPHCGECWWWGKLCICWGRKCMGNLCVFPWTLLWAFRTKKWFPKKIKFKLKQNKT